MKIDTGVLIVQIVSWKAREKMILLLKQELLSLHSETGPVTFSECFWQRLHLNHCRPDKCDAAITLACTWARQDVRLFVLP